MDDEQYIEKVPTIWNKHREILRASFDPTFYSSKYLQNLDDAKDIDPFDHYIRYVRELKCDPSEEFSESFYLECYADVAAEVEKNNFYCGYLHYLTHGANERRVTRREENLVDGQALPSDRLDEVSAPTSEPNLQPTSGQDAGDAGEAPTAGADRDATFAPFDRVETTGRQIRQSLESDTARQKLSAGQEASKQAQVPSTNSAQKMLIRIRESGLFLEDWYRSINRDLTKRDIDLLEHFYLYGCREGRRPNPYFDPAWYLEKYPDIAARGVNPLYHYITAGELEGFQPILYFDTEWYREHYLKDQADSPLAHFLKNRLSGRVSPNPYFDVDYYLAQYPDVALAKIDPFEHYLYHGYLENRNPSADFDTSYYTVRHLDYQTTINPLVHYITIGRSQGLLARQSETENSIPADVKRYSKPGPYFEELNPDRRAGHSDVKLLAFYLPQFHAFAENDEWWGKGFTEWTNIVRALPRFPGHYQPRAPRDLGFYNLTSPEVMRRQTAMAKAAGLFGFCFYFYWFNGKRLMERPIEMFLDDKAIDFPFCLMWANENWTRRWDGAENEVLIEQDYDTGDDVALIREFARHMKDPRYIRVGGRPLLMIYRPGIIPDAAETIARWRAIFETEFSEKPVFIMAQCFGDSDPRKFGFDGAVEFPPHKVVNGANLINQTLTFYDPDFKAQVYDYDDIIFASLSEPMPDFPLIKTVVPSWDNDARLQGKGLVITGSTPPKYETWLRGAISLARRNTLLGEPFVCINAWNEWCEGAYLEPDIFFGSAYLNATTRTLVERGSSAKRKLLLIGHDAFPSGAQHLLLNIGRLLSSRFGIEVAFILLGDGKMVPRYRDIARTDVVGDLDELARLADARKADGFTSAIISTTAAARAAAVLDKAGIPSIMLVHELPRIMKEKRLVDGARAASSIVKALVFPSRSVADRFIGTVAKNHETLPAEIVIQPQGVYRVVNPGAGARERTREALGIAPNDRVFLNIGYADLRKGYDLFFQMWRLSQGKEPRAHFIWCGDMDPDLKSWLTNEIAIATQSGHFHHISFTETVEDYYAAADAFVLTSREDPFPSVVLEAISCGLPVAVFDEAGGIGEIVRPGIGEVVPYGDAPALLEAAFRLSSKAPTQEAVQTRKSLIENDFSFPDYGWKLAQKLQVTGPRVSVIVPNRDYARYLRERIGSILDQAAPIFELIVLDNASTDSSLQTLKAIANDTGRDFKVVAYDENSGSVFEQWRRGVAMARGELVWIAESDDAADPRFLETLLPAFADENVVFAFSDSQAVDSDGGLIWPSYKEYYATISPGILSRDMTMSAKEFLTTHLSVKNLILNVSEVLWRRSALASAMAGSHFDLENHLSMAGDWRVYAEACLIEGARVAYFAEPLNRHRRHPASVTHELRLEKHLAEVKHMHEVMRTRLNLHESLEAHQSDYIEELTKQFGLDKRPEPESAAADNSEAAPEAGAPAPEVDTGKPEAGPTPATDSLDRPADLLAVNDTGNVEEATQSVAVPATAAVEKVAADPGDGAEQPTTIKSSKSTDMAKPLAVKPAEENKPRSKARAPAQPLKS